MKVGALFERVRNRVKAWREWLRLGGRAWWAMVAGVCVLAILAWGASVAVAPPYRATRYVSLARYGYSGVELRIVYPARLYRGDQVAVLTVYARASLPESKEITLILPLPEESLTFVDAQGIPVPARLRIQPGYPEAWPYSGRLSAAQAPSPPRLLGGRTISIVPLVANGETEAIPVPELTLRVRLEGRLAHTWREMAAWVGGWGILLATGAVIFALGGRVWQEYRRRCRLAREQRLAALYTRLRDAIKVEDWNQARAHLEEIRALAPSYRDLDRLDALINAAETASWRRERLYMVGMQAYRERDWPQAIEAFRKIEEETPYYRDVRFLRRTAALYADLRSRDRSLRLQAARQLGEIADLLDMFPLLQALGDKSREVADAAEASFAKIGPDAFDTLLAGLRAEPSAVRERCFRLLQGMGQSIREELLAALHSPDPRVTAAVAQLLRGLGARDALAQALQWIAPDHQTGVVEALIQENEVACEPLVNAMLTAPPACEQVFINALAALKERVDITRYLEMRAKSATEERHKNLLQRALAARPQPFTVVDAIPKPLIPQATNEEPLDKTALPEVKAEKRSLVRRLFERDRG